MVLADCMGDTGWEVFGSDISSRVLERARRGVYSLTRASHLPPAYLKRFCLRGTGPWDGTLLVQAELRKRVRFEQLNLNEPLPTLAPFDVIFLRNVMIYFSDATKREVVVRLVSALKPGGQFFVGHSESLHGIQSALRALAPSVYELPRSGPSRTS